MANGESFTGASLEQALKKDELAAPRSAVLVGMVKTSEKSGNIGFTSAGCDAWTELPTEMIEEAQHVGTQTCWDHSHPVMRIALKEPKTAEAKILAALLAQHQQPQRPLADEPQGGPASGSPMPYPASAAVGRTRTPSGLVGRFPIPWTPCVVTCIEVCTEFCAPTGWDCCRWETRCGINCNGLSIY
jgi:hypothetical protein